MTSNVRSLAGVKTWRLFTGLCIRRPTVITPELSSFQNDVLKTFMDVEFQGSYMSRHERRIKLDEERIRKARAQGPDAVAKATSSGTLITATEQELLWLDEAKHFRPGSRKTENDSTSNQRSTWRCLDRPLILLVQTSVGGKPPIWVLPFVELKPTQTLRQAVDDVVANCLPPSANCKVFGDAPSAVHVYRYREPTSQDRIGVQVYYFNVYADKLWHGDNLKFPDASDFSWVTIDALSKYITNKKMLEVMNSFIVEY